MNNSEIELKVQGKIMGLTRNGDPLTCPYAQPSMSEQQFGPPRFMYRSCDSQCALFLTTAHEQEKTITVTQKCSAVAHSFEFPQVEEKTILLG